jgi:isoleucyl-tRNA synthetase
MDYKNTLNLPKTDFSMKADLPKKEPKILQKWADRRLYELIRKKQSGKPKFILHDGPPYANGNIHLGHVLNKVLKDIVIKYRTMAGYDAPYVPGWDCHGLPIEYQLLKELGKSKHDLNKVDFRKQAREFALRHVNIQREEFKRLGVFGDWENPYLTMDPIYAGTIIDSFTNLYDKGFIYRGLKPIIWCPNCETALAEAEVEYENHVSPSIFVRFKIKKGLPQELSDLTNVSIVIWTTTPWTLPANLAVAVKPEYMYSFVIKKDPDEILLIAKQLVAPVMETIGIEDYEIIKEVKGTELKDVVTQHPFINRESPVVFSPHVTLEHGTGCVHTAPGHGEEDYEVGLHYNLHPYAPVDEKGNFAKEVEYFAGMNVFKANMPISDLMEKNGALLHGHTIEHTYPHCWRCKQPIIYRATRQWFLGIDRSDLRNKTLNIIQKTKWIPEVGEKRIGSMVSLRPDWCLSRQRLWGVAIPVFYCEGCGYELISSKTMERVKDLIEKEGSDVWFIKDAVDLLPAQTKCSECGGSEFKKEEDIIDVWFDSGVSNEAVLSRRSDLGWPADLYLEGSDQHRGWFQTSLLTSVGMKEKAPYKTVLTHGFVVDGEGKKMSKSLGNVITPQDVLPLYGADILRMWAASIDYTGDVPISEEILSQVSDAYRKIRNTFRFLMGNLSDFTPSCDSVPYEKLTPIDLWALGRTQHLIKEVTNAYEDYQFHEAYHAIYNFCVVELSSFYLDILKDRLYTFGANSWERRSSQTVMMYILGVLVRITAPIIPFTAEEVWEYLPKEMKTEESVHLSEWVKPQEKFINSILESRWDQLFQIRAEVLKALEVSRRQGVIGNALEAEICLYMANPELKDFLQGNSAILPSIFIVSQVEVKDYAANDPSSQSALPAGQVWGMYISVKKARGKKCVRCWNWSLTVGTYSDHPELCNRCLDVVNTARKT